MVMSSTLKHLRLSLLTIASLQAVGAADATDDDNLSPYENEVVVVIGDKLPRTVALEVIKSGLSASQSYHPDDADRVVCRIEPVTGSRCKRLWCSTNRELKQIHDNNLNRFAGVGDAITHGAMIEVHSGPDPAKHCTNLAKLEEVLAELPVPDVSFVVISEESIRRFADVYPMMHAIQTDFDSRKMAERDEKRVLQLQAEADAEMISKIEAVNLDVDEYNQIASRLKSDEKLKTRIYDLIEK